MARGPRASSVGSVGERFSWGSLSAILTVLATAGAGAAWFFSYAESSEQAARREAVIRSEIQTEAKHLREEAKADRIALQRAQAWAAVANKRMEVLVLRNRVNDCRNKPLKSQLEQNACKQYEDEYNDAAAGYQRLIQSATELSRMQ